jgi:hypothetical protein
MLAAQGTPWRSVARTMDREERSERFRLFTRVGSVVLLALAASAMVCCSGGTAQVTPTAPPEFTPPLPWVYSQIFSAASPFHTTVTTLKANGAITLPQEAMTSLWSQGISNQGLSITSYMYPVYVSLATDPVKTFTCGNAGAACDANNLRIHIPSGAVPEPQSDAHIAVIDTTQNIEVDGWACTVSPSTVACQWGGGHPFNGTGLENVGSTSVKAGYAAGLFEITAQELLNGQINHALGLNTNCLNNPTVYPADQNAGGTDETCGGQGPPSYGDMIHLLWTPDQIAASAYSGECKTVLTALATYGAYTYDTGNGGLALLTQHQLSYTAVGQTSPWATTIIPDLVAAGDGDGTAWYSCMNRLSSSDFELLQIPSGSY